MGENTAAEVIEALAVGLADFAQKEAFEPGAALTIVGADLSEEPVRFAAAASTAIADGGGAIGQVTKPGRGAGGELTRLENDPGADKVLHLVGRAPGGKAGSGILLGVEFFTHKTNSVRCGWLFSGSRDRGRVAVGRNLAIDPRNGFEEMLLDGGEGGLGGFGKFSTRQGEPADAGGDFQSARDLCEGHLVEILFAEAFEETLGGGEEFLGGIPLLLPETIETRGPIGGALATQGGLGLNLFVEETGVDGMQALLPVKPAGPVFDGGEAFTEFVGYGLMGPVVSELEEGRESAVGSRRLARGARKGKLGRINSERRAVTGFGTRAGASRRGIGGQNRRGVTWGRKRCIFHTQYN